MRTALLDVNLFLAIVWPAHEHHAAAHAWLSTRGRRARWASCPVTQLGLVRLLSNPALSPDALEPADAVALLARNLEHPLHEFWPDRLAVSAALRGFERRVTGHQQFTDAYLLALAAGRAGRLATFDRAIGRLASESGLTAHVEIVPAR